MTLETIFYLCVLFIVLMMTGGAKKSPEAKSEKKFPKEKGKEQEKKT